MDIFAHALWAGAAAEVARRKGARVRPIWAACWGAFPDLFAFAVPVASMIVLQLAGHRVPHGPGAPHWRFVGQLYHISHSLVICAVFLTVVWLLMRRPAFSMLGWPLHILIDIPTHSKDMYPTPFLWPVSPFHTGGIAWWTPWFLTATYVALAIVYVSMWRTRPRVRPPLSSVEGPNCPTESDSLQP